MLGCRFWGLAGRVRRVLVRVMVVGETNGKGSIGRDGRIAVGCLRVLDVKSGGSG